MSRTAQAERRSQPIWLTVDELADRLQIPKATIYQWRGRQLGPLGVKFGRFVRYRLSDVERWEQDQEALSRGR